MTVSGAHRERARPCRGAVAIEVVLIVQTVTLVLMMTVQWAIHEQASRAVSAAAREGAVTAASYGGTDDLGRAAAMSTLAVAGDGIDSPSISFVRTPETVTASVTASVPQLIPGFGGSVSSQQTAPLEGFVS